MGRPARGLHTDAVLCRSELFCKVILRMPTSDAHQYDPSKVDVTISATETMSEQYYFLVGESAIRAIDLALSAANAPRVDRILDLPCGHGRVTRHLRARFPDASIDACDLDKAGVDFCSEIFGAKAIYSTPELTEAPLSGPYDLIWVGSLFTHVSRETFKRWSAYLATLLSERGIVVASMHGRYAEVMHSLYPYLPQDTWDRVIKPAYDATGYGYADYELSDQVALHNVIPGDYGISIARPSVVLEDIAAIPDTRIFLFAERLWAGHHDVVAYGRPDYRIVGD